MNKIITLIGLPGAGKTTFARAFMAKHTDYKLHDVYEYVKKYKDDNGKFIDENLAIKAYEEMYEDLEKNKDDVILELGTNHHEFNAQKLKAISERADLTVFLCLLSKEECLAREEKRDRMIDKEELMKVFERNFPEIHENAFDNIGLDYHYLQMGQTPTEMIAFVEETTGISKANNDNDDLLETDFTN